MQNILLYSIIGAVALIAISYGKTAKGLTELSVSLSNLKIHSFKSGQLILRLSLRIVNAGKDEVTPFVVYLQIVKLKMFFRYGTDSL